MCLDCHMNDISDGRDTADEVDEEEGRNLRGFSQLLSL